MSLASSIASFAQGFAGSVQNKRDRAERTKLQEQSDRLIDLMGQQIKAGGAMQGSGTMGAEPQPGGLSYGAAAPTSGTMAGGTAGGQASAAAFPRSKAVDFMALMDRHEGAGDYDTLFGHAQRRGQFAGTRISDMTISQALDFASPRGAYGQWVASKNNGTVATPMGRHQIVGSTLRRAVEQMGLDPNTTRFDRDTQDAVFRHLATQRLRGAATPEAARTAIRNEWVGFRKVPDHMLDQAIHNFRVQHMGGGLGARPPAS
ncbi:hypothetical protein [Paracoccus sp. NSM]|uniref:hypothetical protein n=1 Tax=Paracoccus sp. NSM TaxID=3457784 RepID=UPI0040369888